MKSSSGFGLISLLLVIAIVVMIAATSLREIHSYNQSEKTVKDDSGQTTSYQGAIDSAENARDMLEHPSSNP